LLVSAPPDTVTKMRRSPAEPAGWTVTVQRPLNRNKGMCRNAGFSLNVVHEVNNIIAAFTLVAAGHGLAFSAPTMQELWPDVVFRAIRDDVPQLEYAVAYRKDAHSPVLDSFLRVVRETSRRKG
jgi:DNA-binding transcriptional LysR family regulator